MGSWPTPAWGGSGVRRPWHPLTSPHIALASPHIPLASPHMPFVLILIMSLLLPTFLCTPLGLPLQPGCKAARELPCHGRWEQSQVLRPSCCHQCGDEDPVAPQVLLARVHVAALLFIPVAAGLKHRGLVGSCSPQGPPTQMCWDRGAGMEGLGPTLISAGTSL